MTARDNEIGPRRVNVEADEAGRRLDNFLLARLRGVPRSRIYRMIRGGEVRVNKRRARPDQRLAAGDEVRIPPARIRAPRRAPGDPSWIEGRVIYEDRDLLVLDKPAGLAAHGGSGISHGAIELLRAARDGRDDLELVHRLDRDTSGCLLISKRRASLRSLHAQFRAGEVEKHYTALLLGRWSGGEQTCDAPLLTRRRRGGERFVTVAAGGKPARSRFRPERRFGEATLADVVIETGRTHQIRVHAAHLGHPVAGDSRYGPADDPVARTAGLDRLFLHADSLAVESPRGDRVISVRAPLDPRLQRILDTLDAGSGPAGRRSRGGQPA